MFLTPGAWVSKLQEIFFLYGFLQITFTPFDPLNNINKYSSLSTSLSFIGNKSLLWPSSEPFPIFHHDLLNASIKPRHTGYIQNSKLNRELFERLNLTAPGVNLLAQALVWFSPRSMRQIHSSQRMSERSLGLAQASSSPAVTVIWKSGQLTGTDRDHFKPALLSASKQHRVLGIYCRGAGSSLGC